MNSKESIPANGAGEVTALLRAWGGGDDRAGDRLMERVYRELRSMASQRLRGERGDHTLQPTALVHEAFLRLVDQRQLDWRSRSQFFDLAGRMMRRILVDHARHRARVKRGGDVKIVTLERPDRLPAHLAGDDVLALDEALHRLARHDSRKARIVELHFFAGLSVVETAEVLGCSKATVSRDWRFAKAWIGKALTAVGSRAAGRAPGDDANAGAEARRGA